MAIDIFVQYMHKTVTAATPWLVGAAAGLFALWIAALCREARPFAKALELFSGLTPWRRLAVVCAVSLCTLWGGSKESGSLSSALVEDAPSAVARVAEAVQPQAASEGQPETTNALAVTGFAVDRQNGALAFETTWATNLFDRAVSRRLLLFSSTNLLERTWTPLGAFAMPSGTNACAFAVTSEDVGSAMRPWFLDSLAGAGFYRFGVDFDSDGDGLADGVETLWTLTDPEKADSDGDGLSDGEEVALGTDPLSADTDGDTMPDGWEHANGLDPLSAVGDDGADGDPDGDFLSNVMEMEYGTDPSAADTDGDGLLDGEETGGIFATNAIPWLAFDAGEDLTAEISTNLRRCVSRALPAPLRIQGETVTNLTVSANGLLFLNKAGYSNFGNSTSSADFANPLDGNALVLAPYLQYARIRSDVAGRQTSVKYGTATHDGEGYLLVEYLNSFYDTSSSKTNAISFQVAIPTNALGRAYARYRDVTGQRMDGRYASIGMQTFGGRWLHAWCYRSAGRVSEGLALEFLFGANTDPLLADTDGDGLEDGREVDSGLDPIQPDSDGDGMNDGWEYEHRDAGFDPASDNAADDNPDNDSDADPDGDGLTNGEECGWGTNPANEDTDGDGVCDGEEVGQNSDPSDGEDGGRPNTRVPVPFRFGDPSSSHSEKYRLEVRPVSGVGGAPSSFSWLNERYGESETKTAMLKPGWKYEVRLYHAGTDSDYNNYPRPDYDYELYCGGESLPTGVVVDDPSSLFGRDFTSIRFAGAGKAATVAVYAVTGVRICDPDDPSWAELDVGRVVLDDEELRIKVEIVPQLDSLAQCRQAFGSSLTVKTSGTCPTGTSVPIPDDAAIVNLSGKSEIRMSKPRRQLAALGLLPSEDDDDVDEMAWYDAGVDDVSSVSNLSDSRAFSEIGYQFRGMALRPSVGDIDSTPPVSANSESFCRSAGCEIVTVEYGGIVSPRRQIMNQADYFYYSGHGYHSDAGLRGFGKGPRLTPSLVAAHWNRDLKCVIFAGCSVLDVNDYNGNYLGTTEHESSPGKLWAAVEGPDSFLGYAYKAPSDAQGADKIARDWVSYRGAGDVDAWMRANDNRSGRNACAIERIDDSHIRYSYFRREKGFLYNSYSLTNVIEEITR